MGRVLKFDPEDHSYTLDGKPIPSSSVVLNPRSHGAATVYSVAVAMEKGTRIHAWLEWNDRNGNGLVCTNSDKINQYITAWTEWLRSQGYPRFVLIEKPIFGEMGSMAWGTTPDRVMQMPDGKLWLVDIKTGKPHKNHGPQIWGQKVAYEQRSGLEIDQQGCLYLNDTDGVVRATFVPYLGDIHFNTFHDALSKWWADHPEGR